MTISRWERGLTEPTAEHYLRLGTLVGKHDCWFFWERAGLFAADLMRALPARMQSKLPLREGHELEMAHAGTTEKHRRDPDVVALPLLKAVAGSHGNEGDRRKSLDHVPATKLLGAPKEWCPNPKYTSLIRVKGDSMEPLICDGDILAIDSWQTDRSDLDGKIVAVSSDEKGLCISRYRQYRNTEVLEPENRRYSAIELRDNRGWRIVGRVLWWISQAP